MNRLFHFAAPLVAAAFTLLAISADAAPTRQRVAAKSAPQTPNWARQVTFHDQGHILGNPDADTKLVEYMSYTCSHCYEFSRTGDPMIRLLLVPKGTLSYEIRHLLRDPVDLTAALLAHCGDVDDFPANHEALISKQPEWLETASKTTQAQRTRWSFGTNAARWRAIASDLGFYAIMEERGYNRSQIDRCLSDGAKANALATASARDVATYRLQGTPSFVMNGKLLDGVYNWEALKPYLEKVE